MLSLEDFQGARSRLAPVLNRTPLIKSQVFSQESGNEVYLKAENLQKTGSFKVRGAYNKIAKLAPEERARGVIASSAGNHAQGVALAASQLGIKAVIVMPRHSPLIKVEASQAYGAQVILEGETYDDAYAHACRLQAQEGYSFIHPFDDEDVIEGQGTLALEVLEDLPDVDIILVPVGGGGLISGLARAAKLVRPQVQVIGVEPEGAASATASLEAGQLVGLDQVQTIADGTAVKRLGHKTLAYIRDEVDGIVTVSDYDLMDSFLLLTENHKLVVENSGVLPVAALKKLDTRNKKVACILSGGNMDVLTMASMINKGLVNRGRIFKFSVYLPDQPGQLEGVARTLASLNANVIKLDHNQFINLDRFTHVELQVTVETKGQAHIAQIKEALLDQGYLLDRERAS